MKHIPQKDATGCGVACVAMVADVEYDVAAAEIFPNMTDKKTVFKTRWGQLRDGLVDLGREDAINARFVTTRIWQDIPKGAIVRLLDKPGSDHWVVKDDRGDAYMDPSAAGRIMGPPKHIHGFIDLRD